MSELGKILEMWRSRRDDCGVLATLVRVEGSSYRRPGARMFVHAGRYAGSISGGCLESEVTRKAQWLTRAGAAVERYSTRFENPLDRAEASAGPMRLDDVEVPYGLGCGGVLDLLLEPVALPEANAMLRALDAASGGETFRAATALPNGEARFARVILREDGSLFFASADCDLTVQAKLMRMAGQAPAGCAAMDEAGGAFVETILPPQRLVILGAGEDARPLAGMAHLLGWRVVVADGRGWLAQATRFPDAEQVVALSGHAENLEALRLMPRDAVAVLTHSFEQDRKFLRQLLPLELGYVGLLGARARSRLLLTEAAQTLGWTLEECMGRCHAPIGLNVGGDTPEAVALAILSEIQWVLHGGEVGSSPQRANSAHVGDPGSPPQRANSAHVGDPGSRCMTEEARRDAPERPYFPTHCSLDHPPDAIR